MRTHAQPRRNSPQRRSVKRAIAIWALAAGAAWVAGKQIRHTFLEKTPKTNQTALQEKRKQATKEVKIRELWVAEGTKNRLYPEFMSEELFKNSYRGTDKEIRDRWSNIGKKAYDAFRYRAEKTGKKFHPLPVSEVNSICQNVSTKTGVPAPLIKAIFKQEAQFDPYAAAADGGMGAGQLMPITLLDLHQRGLSIKNPFDPVENLTGAATHFKRYMKQAQARTFDYEGQAKSFNQLPTRIQYMIALRMYNAGPGNTFTEKNHGKNGYNVSSIIAHDYPQKVIAYFEQYYREQ